MITVAPPPIPFKYTDHRPTYNNSEHYEATNEQLPRLRELTDKVSPTITGAIASAGEVPLAVMLLQPSAEQCVAIDQSYGSLHWAYLKALVIHLCSPDEAHRLLTTPPPIRAWSEPDKTDPRWPADLVAKIDELTPAPLKGTYRSAGYDIWKAYTSPSNIAIIKDNLHKLHLVHGDIRDLAEFSQEKYDLLYLSNATEKTNYKRDQLALENFNSFIRRGGYVVTTGAEKDDDNKWKELENLPHLSGHLNPSWRYRLLQLQAWPEARTYAKQAWERMRAVMTKQKPSSTSYYMLPMWYPCPSAYCTGALREFYSYQNNSNMYCAICGSYQQKAPLKIIRLHERYPIKVA